MSSASEALQEAAKGNLASGTKLSNALPKALPALKRFVDEEKYEDADEELKKWKRHTERLQEQIDNQLSHCRSLRENKTLLSLYSEDKGVVLARKSQEVLSFLKSDIRSLNHNFPQVAYQLTEENEYESKNDDAELDEAEKIFRDRRQAEGPSRREKVLRELNVLLEKADPTALPMEEKETPSVNLEGIFELLKLRGQMTSNVLFQAIKQKKELDRAFGYDEDFRKVRRHDFNESDEVFQMTSVLHNGKKMANELKSCRMALAPDAGETMHQLISDNATMTSKLKESEAALKKATALLEEFQSGKSLSTVERIKMQEALSKYETVHSTLRKEQEINAMNTATTNQLKDQVKVLNSRNERLKRNLAAKISWFDPQIQSVEMALKETKKSLDTVTMDVTLMSRMYQESLGELNRMSKKAKAVEEERDDMGAKMAELIKKIQIEKRENRRKDKIIDRVMAARIVRNRSIQEQGENMAETQKQLDESEKTLVTLRYRIETLETEKETLEDKLLEFEFKLEEETKKCEGYKQKWSRADAQRMSLKTIHDSHLRDQKEQDGNKSNQKDELLQLREEKKTNMEIISELEDHCADLQERVKTLEGEKKAYLKKQKRR